MILPSLCLAGIASVAQAVRPPPDGGYPGGNTAEGQDALFNLTTGLDNTAIGFDALYYNTTGGSNTANGFQALLNNTIGFSNTAHGSSALQNNTIGICNTAGGVDALFSNTTGRLAHLTTGEKLDTSIFDCPHCVKRKST